MTPLHLFGLFAVTAMLVCYAFEARSSWFILAFAVACWLGSAYGFLQGAWPFGLVEAIWGGVDRSGQQYGIGRFSLWLGDLGAAVYAMQCVHADATLPTLERW